MIDLESGVRVAVRRPVPPRWLVKPPVQPRALVVPVRGAPGPEGPPGLSGDTNAQVLVDAHRDDPEPHPAYDDVMDLTLLFENGLI